MTATMSRSHDRNDSTCGVPGYPVRRHPDRRGGGDGVEGEAMIVYAVVHGNYYPREINSLWTTEELAQAKADGMDGDWRVIEMQVLDKPEWEDE